MTTHELKKGRDDDLSTINSKDGRNISFVTDEELEKWKVSRITANTKIKSAWGVRYSTELADVCNVKYKSV